ncbi:hypothetical protein C8R47DRAFT_1297677 [Mycena vitilis]|nr:hypothetical protein C8R47DRAFT_1297677 [Mycena vitilis]
MKLPKGGKRRWILEEGGTNESSSYRKEWVKSYAITSQNDRGKKKSAAQWHILVPDPDSNGLPARSFFQNPLTERRESLSREEADVYGNIQDASAREAVGKDRASRIYPHRERRCSNIIHGPSLIKGLESSDVLALASGQKAMAFWLWYQGQSQAKTLAWHGFWPGSDVF